LSILLSRRSSNAIALPLQQPAISVHINLMEYRGVRYTIRIGITRGQWQVAIYLPDNELPKEKSVIGTRQDAEITARSIIDAWMTKRSREHLL
jgi:hypothetical protein